MCYYYFFTNLPYERMAKGFIFSSSPSYTHSYGPSAKMNVEEAKWRKEKAIVSSFFLCVCVCESTVL